MKRLAILTSLLILSVLSLVYSQGTLRYVRPSATGNGSGMDWANSCGGFSGACAVGSLVRGGTYYVAGGSYSAPTTWNTSNSGTNVITIRKATEADHGTGVGWSAALDGQVNWTNKWTIGSGYWNFEGAVGRSVPLSQAVPYGFRIADNGSSGQALIEITTGDNITVGHTDIDGVQCCNGSFTGPYGIHSNDLGVNFRFHHGAVHNIKSDPIHLNSPGSGVIIEYSYIALNEGLLSNNHGQGIWMQGYTDSHIRYNFLEDVVGTAYTFCGSGAGNFPCSNVQWYGNVLYHTRTHPQSSNGNQSGDEATYIWECTDNNPCPGFKIYNNTIVGFDDWNSGTYPGTYSGASEASNNLWYNITNSGLAIHFAQNNNTFLNSPGLAGTGNQTVGSGVPNPFVSIADRDFRLVTPTMAGKALVAPYNVDPTGAARGSDGTWDRGAFEFGGTAPPPPGPQPLGILTTALPSGQATVPYSTTVVASGGTGPYSWTATGPPAGLVLSSSGTLSGTPTETGSFSVNASVTDSAAVPVTVSRALALTIVQAPPPPPPPPAQGCFQSNGSTWQWNQFAVQVGSFAFTFEGTPLAANVDTVLGLSAGQATSYSSLAVIARFHDDGTIDARNGGAYASLNRTNYVAGTKYGFRGQANLVTRRFSLWVTPAGGAEVQIALDYAFRTEQANVTSLSYWTVYADSGSALWCAFTLSNAPPPPPQPISVTVSPETSTLLVGGTQQFVASVSNSTNTGVDWLTGGGTVSATGLFTATVPGTFTVTARSVADSTKSDTATVVVSVEPPPPPTGITLNCTGSADDNGVSITVLRFECRP